MYKYLLYKDGQYETYTQNYFDRLSEDELKEIHNNKNVDGFYNSLSEVRIRQREMWK